MLESVIFHTGQVVICWRLGVNEDKPGYSILASYPSWDAFLPVHARLQPLGGMGYSSFGMVCRVAFLLSRNA
jgi:hypothetical protein